MVKRSRKTTEGEKPDEIRSSLIKTIASGEYPELSIKFAKTLNIALKPYSADDMNHLIEAIAQTADLKILKNLDGLRKIEKQRTRLLEAITSGESSTLIQKVGNILNLEPATRDSDIALSLKLYKTFHGALIEEGDYIKFSSFYRLPKMYDIQRLRAHIQNTLGLFPASTGVRDERRKREIDEFETYSKSSFTAPSILIYCDESGKTNDYLVIGSVWVLDFGKLQSLKASIRDWRKYYYSKDQEFKFNKINGKTDLDITKEFFKRCLQSINQNLFGFKAIVVDSRGIKEKSKNEHIYRAHKELVLSGFEFDLAKGRISLPRMATIIKDRDQPTDPLFIAEMERDLKTDANRHFDNRVFIDGVHTLDSKNNDLIQLADLFSGAISRKWNYGHLERKNEKDEFADFICDSLLLNRENTLPHSGTDFTMIKVLP